MHEERHIREVITTIERWGRSPAEFQVAPDTLNPGWITVRSPTRARSYPLGRETAILVSAELRHGLLD